MKEAQYDAYLIVDKDEYVYTNKGWIDPTRNPSSIVAYTLAEVEEKIRWAESYKDDTTSPGRIAQAFLNREPEIREATFVILF